MTWIGRISVLVTLESSAARPRRGRRTGETTRSARSVERRSDVPLLRDGVALHPKTPMPGVRSVEITGGTIAIDGQPATGAELVQQNRRGRRRRAAAVLLLRCGATLALRRCGARRPQRRPPRRPLLPEIAAPPLPPAPPEGDRPPRTRCGRGRQTPGDSRNEGDRVRLVATSRSMKADHRGRCRLRWWQLSRSTARWKATSSRSVAA